MLRASPSSDRCDLSSTVSETRSDFPALCRIAQSELNHPATDSVAVCVPAVARRADSAWQVALLRQQCCRLVHCMNRCIWQRSCNFSLAMAYPPNARLRLAAMWLV